MALEFCTRSTCPALSTERMFAHLPTQVFGGGCQVDSRRRDVGVTHHRRERVNVATAFEHEGGERMA